MIRSFRNFLVLAFLGSLVLPLFAILAAAANIGEPLSPAGRLLIGIYGAFALGMLVIFFHLVRNLEPYLLKRIAKAGRFP